MLAFAFAIAHKLYSNNVFKFKKDNEQIVKALEE